MEAIYKLKFNCGRQGELTGIFVAQKAHVEYLIKSGIEVYFGEALGKHSEIYGPIEEKDIQMVSDDDQDVSRFISLHLKSGRNPFNKIYLNEEDPIDDETVLELIERRLAKAV